MQPWCGSRSGRVTFRYDSWTVCFKIFLVVRFLATWTFKKKWITSAVSMTDWKVETTFASCVVHTRISFQIWKNKHAFHNAKSSQNETHSFTYRTPGIIYKIVQYMPNRLLVERRGCRILRSNCTWCIKYLVPDTRYIGLLVGVIPAVVMALLVASSPILSNTQRVSIKSSNSQL